VQAAADWVTVSVRPAIVSVPVRGLVNALAATVYVSHAVPLPCGDPLMVIHELSLDDDHSQALAVLMNALLEPPPAPMDMVEGDTV
jgi:hypothetical protein